MEGLTKSQFLLLVILVTFVVSIATGIITFTLLSGAPTAVTQTINRVVETTVERVVPIVDNKGVTQTIVVTDESLVVSGIEKLSKSLVRIKNNTINDPSFGMTVGMGVVVSQNGLIITDGRLKKPNTDLLAVFPDGAKYSLSAINVSDDSYGMAFFKVEKNIGDSYQFQSTIFSGVDLKLGQTVVSIYGLDKNIISSTLVSDIINSESPDSALKTIIVPRSIPVKDDVYGSIIMNLSGEIAGIRSQTQITDDATTSYVSAKILRDVIQKAVKQLSSQ